MDVRLDLIVKGAAGFAVGFWMGLIPLVQLLLVFMVIDIATGVLAAAGTRSIASEVAFRGMTKKAIALLIVTSAAAIETYAGAPLNGLPIDETVAGFYCASELLSIIENAGEAGLPIPQILKDMLAKLSPDGTPDTKVS